MAFDSVTVNLSINGDTPQVQWRQDAVAANSIVSNLSSAVGVNTYRWRLIGRPEGSAAGGTGPEPIALGTSSTCAFTVDIPGTYIVECLVNGGAPDATIIVGGCAILETVLSPDNLPLRLLGPGETSQDIAEPLVAQGWLKMLNRWLKLVATQGASGTSDHLVIVAPGKTADTLSARLISSDGTVMFTIIGNQLSLSTKIADPGIIASVSGTVIIPYNLESATVSGTEALIGISATNRLPGSRVWITFTQDRPLQGGGSPGIGFAPLSLETGGEGETTIDVTAWSVAGFKLRYDSSTWDEMTVTVH